MVQFYPIPNKLKSAPVPKPRAASFSFFLPYRSWWHIFLRLRRKKTGLSAPSPRICPGRMGEQERPPVPTSPLRPTGFPGFGTGTSDYSAIARRQRKEEKN
jgi:hypothetical protein